MRALVQRVSSCCVRVDGAIVGQIGRGLMILLGVRSGDAEHDAAYLAGRCAALRIFPDAEDKMNLSVRDIDGSALVVSQFTLYGDTRKGNRPSFVDAAPPETAERLYEAFKASLSAELGKPVASGVFRAMMEVELVNDGPVTVMIESKASPDSGS